MTEAWSVRDAGHSELVLGDNPQRWGGERGGRGLQDRGGTCVSVADSYQCMTKTTTIL